MDACQDDRCGFSLLSRVPGFTVHKVHRFMLGDSMNLD